MKKGEQQGKAESEGAAVAEALRPALLVDDVEYNLELLQAFLLPLGYGSTFAMNVADAKRALAHANFDVVFLDGELPDGLGCDLAAEIAALELALTPPVIGMSAADGNDMMLRFFSAGAGAFMKKPISFGLVSEKLRQCGLIDPGVVCEESPRPQFLFENLRFMSGGDGGRYLKYLRDLDRQLATEVFTLGGACHKGETETARLILHRMLSLTPFVESRLFTCVVESCQMAARKKDLSLLCTLTRSLVAEHRLVRVALSDEVRRCHQGQTPSLRKSA